MNAGAKVIHASFPASPPAVGSGSWAEAIRSEVKAQVVQLDQGYVDFAKNLMRVAQTHIDNDPKKPRIYTLWGYPTFDEWAEGDLNIAARKARSYQQIASMLEVELAALDPEIRSGLYALGWSKLRELTKVLTVGNAAAWLTLAQSCTYRELEVTARTSFQHAVKVTSKLPSTPSAATPQGLPGTDDGAPVAASPAPSLPAGVTPAMAVMSDSKAKTKAYLDANVPDGKTAVLTARTIQLYPDQAQLIDAALVRAQEVSGKESPGMNLTIICQMFLAQGGFLKAEQSKMIFFQSLAESLGLHITVHDVETKAFLFETED